jgi:hypothetical protein
MNVGGKPASFIAAHLAFRHFGKQGADFVKHTGVSTRVGAGSAPDRVLGYIDYFIQLIEALDPVMRARDRLSAMKVTHQGRVKGLGN